MRRLRSFPPGTSAGVQEGLFAVDDAGAVVPGDRDLISARYLARRLGHAHPPTEEQARAVEHLDDEGRLAPYLVVAGAGSGKTETMAARVVWLVANRIVRPERILGLTFTRKAAGELAERVRRRLAELARSGVLALDADDDWLTGEPTVATYHSYAAGLFAEHALRIGQEPSARLLPEAATWQYAGRVVDSYDGPMTDIDWGPPTVVGAVRALAGDLAEHLADVDDVRSFTQRLLDRLSEIPRAPGQRTKADRYQETLSVERILRRRLALLPLVEAYGERKRRADALDYGDQIAMAARIAREHPEVGRGERGRYDVVLLDEYQDTGTAQRVLLGSLFGEGHAVTAVGDPCQSIYGWRGASAGNLRRFADDFRQRDGRPSEQVDLTTSFRNGGRILAVANRLSAPLRACGVPVRDLRPGPKGADAGEVVHACLTDAVAEAEWVADQVEGLVRCDDGRPPRFAPADVAILTRARAQFERIETALRRREIPVEVSGLGGLLSTPEVTDVVATLAAVADPLAGAAVLRLLTGARWRLGPRDLEGLARRAKQLATPQDDHAAAALRDAALQADTDLADAGSLVEALDDLGPASAYSPSGYRRLVALRAELRMLRRHAEQPLPELVAEIIATSRLDVEVAARPGLDPSVARAHLDRFLDVAAEFAQTEESATLSGFLAYLEAAAEHERGLDLGRVQPSGEAVQLLTMHGSKGLEWPVVVLPGLTCEVFPARPRESSDWCANAKVLPFPLRGDAGDLPALDVNGWHDQVEVRDALAEHKKACAARAALEERRLLYVAVTRAEELLVCSGYWWDHTSKPRGPSPFLTEIRDVCDELGIGRDAGWAAKPADDAKNPLIGEPLAAVWPADPLTGERRAALEAAAALVRAAATGESEPAASQEPTSGTAHPDDRVAAWRDEVDKLLAERGSGSEHPDVVNVELPQQLSVSQLVALRRDPAELARWIRRPVPLPPAPLARRGTAFHAWLEQRFDGGRLLDVDELPGSADAGAAGDSALSELKERFLASEWAERQPVADGVEVPFEMLVEGIVVRGRMDAVFQDGAGIWDVVDWKTGRLPTGQEAAAAAVQLAAYRLAWHRLSGAPLDDIRAAFHYVRSARTVRPVDLLDEGGLAALIRSVPVVD